MRSAVLSPVHQHRADPTRCCASALVDTDLARWAEGKIARGCHPAPADPTPACEPPTSQSARRPPARGRSPASGDPVARQYGLTTYQRNQF